MCHLIRGYLAEVGRLLIRAVGLVATTGIVGAAAVEQVIQPPGFETTEGGGGATGLSSVIRMQQVYAASGFTNGPIQITEVRWRPSVIFGGPFVATVNDLELRFSTTTQNSDALSPIFAENVGTDERECFRGPIQLRSSFTGPLEQSRYFDIVVPLTVPFVYDPAAGNLLLDIRNYTGASVQIAVDSSSSHQDGASRVFSLNATADQATGLDSGADVILLVTTDTLVGIPAILVEPKDQTVFVGGKAIFELVAGGMPPLSHRWHLDGQPLAGAVSNRLELTGITLAQGGIYTATVSNALGMAVTREARLTVIDREAVTVPGGTEFSPGGGLGNTLGVRHRLQDVYSASLFPPNLLRIEQLRLRQTVFLGQPFTTRVDRLEIRLSTTQRAPGGLSLTFAANTGLDETEVFDGAIDFISGNVPAPNGTRIFDLIIPLTTPFVYNPALGNLLVDVRNHTGAPYQIVNDIGSQPGGLASRVSTSDPNGSVAVSALTGVDVLQLIYQPLGPIVPFVVTQPASQTQLVGRNVLLEVHASGTPPLQFQWLFNDVPRPGATNRSLSLPAVTTEQAGFYRVRVENAVGSVLSGAALLDVYDARATIIPAVSQTAEGSSSSATLALPLRIQTVYASTNFPRQLMRMTQFRFRPDGGSGSIPASHNDLVIRLSTTPFAPGALQPAFTGNAGADELVVFDESIWLGSQAVPAANGSLAFDIIVPFQRPFTYDPSAGNLLIDIQNFTRATRLITDANSSIHDGAARQFSTNPLATAATGGDTGADVIEIIWEETAGFEPVIRSTPRPLSAVSGQTVRFEVAATGSAPLSYQWYLEEAPLAAQTSPALVITPVGLDDAGLYHVEVANSFGTNRTAPVRLRVLEGSGWIVPPEFAAVPGGSAGGTLTSRARVQTIYGASLFPAEPIEIREIRFRPSVALGGPFSTTVPDLRVRLSTSGRLPDGLSAAFTDNVGPDETEVFLGTLDLESFFSTQAAGEAPLADIVIPLTRTFIYDPALGNLLVDVRNLGGIPVAIYTDLSASPIDSASRLSTDVTFAQVGSRDTGADVIELIGEPATGVVPFSTFESEDQAVDSSGTVQLAVNLFGSQPMQVRWYHEGELLPGATHSILLLSDIQVHQAGSYWLTASNAAGVFHSAEMKVTVNPVECALLPEGGPWSELAGSDLLGAAGLRLQQVFTFPPAMADPMLIKRLRLSPHPEASPFLSAVGHLQLRLSSTERPPGDLSPIFANNVGFDETVVFDGPLELASEFVDGTDGLKAFDISIALTRHFYYDPRRGHLLVDFRNLSGSTVPAVAAVEGVEVSASAVVGSAGAPIGTPSDTVNLIQFCFSPETNRPAAPALYVYDLSADYDIKTNPNGPWTYGFSRTLEGPVEVLEHGLELSLFGQNYQGWQYLPNQSPTVWHNHTDATVVSENGAGFYPPGTVWLAAGPDGSDLRFGVVRFVVPASRAGLYRVEAAVEFAIPGNSSARSEFHLRRNGDSLLSANLAVSDTASFSNELVLASGDVFDFLVGRGEDDRLFRSSLKFVARFSLLDAVENFETLVVPAANEHVDGSQTGGGGSALFRDSARMQAVYEAAQFPATPITLHEIRLRPSATMGAAFEARLRHLEIDLSTTSRMPDLLSPVFALNQGSDSLTVYQGTIDLASQWIGTNNSPRAFDIVIPFSKPFYYDPAAGNLLVEWRNFFSSGVTLVDSSGAGADGASRAIGMPVGTEAASGRDTRAEVLQLVYQLANVPPVIIVPPQSQTVRIDGDAIFRAEAAGSQPLGFQWYFNNAVLPGETHPMLVLRGVSPAEAGGYTVVVSNPVGSITSEPALLTVVSSPACSSPSSDLVAWWTGDGGGSEVTGAHPAEASAGIEYVQGQVVQAFGFDEPDDQVRVPASPALNVGLGQGFTVELWLQPSAVLLPQPLLEWNDGLGNIGVHLWLGLPGDVAGGGLGSVGATLVDTLGQSHSIASPAHLIEPGVFQHVAWTYDRALGQARLYLDGRLIAERAVGSFALATASDLYFGRRLSGPLAGLSFQGRMDEITLYSRALEADEVATVHYAGASGKCLSARPPTITRQPTPLSVSAGQPASLAVRAAGTPPLSYQWTHQGTAVPGQAKSALVLTNAQLPAAGIYQVIVSSPFGSVQSEPVALSVTATPSSPTITAHPVDQTVPRGANAIFRVAADGTEPLRFQWQFNQVPISGKTNATLEIVNVQSSQAGFYQVTVLNEAGMVESLPAALVIVADQAPPVIYFESGARNVLVGGQFTVMVEADGSSPLVYRWFRNGVELQEASGPTLMFSNVVEDQAGVYTVTISNLYGSVSTLGASVNIQANPGNGTVLFQNELHNRVYGVDGLPLPVGARFLAQLYRGSFPPEPGAELHPIGGSVRFGPVPGLFDGGIRYVPGILPGGPAALQVRVWDSQAGSTFEGAQLAGGRTGFSEVFLVHAGGGPFPTLPLFPMDGFQLNPPPGSLPPTIHTELIDQVVRTGEALVLQVEAGGTPPVEYRWFHEGLPVTGANQSSLFIPSAGLADQGLYQVVVGNDAGATTSRVATVNLQVDRLLRLRPAPPIREGESVALPLELISGGEVRAATFVLLYAPDFLSNPQIEWADPLAAALTEVNSVRQGELRFSLVWADGMAIQGTQTLATVRFRGRSVPGTVQTDLRLNLIEIADTTGQLMLYGNAVEGAGVTIIGSGQSGDNNGNGRLDIGDVTLLLRLLTGVDSVRAWDVARNDMNSNGYLDSGDSVLLLRAVLDALTDVGDGGGGLLESTLLTPSQLIAVPGQPVQIQVRLANIRTPLMAVAFALEYPAEHLTLVDATAHKAGPIIPAGTAVVWDVEGGYEHQSGLLRFAASSANAWPMNQGIVAELTFRTRAAPSNSSSQWIRLTALEITPDGYSMRRLPSAQTETLFLNLPQSAQLTPLFLDSVGRFWMLIDGESDLTYTVESSSDLNDWSSLMDVTIGQPPNFITAPANALDRTFYRARLRE